MNIAIYGRNFQEEFKTSILLMFDILRDSGVKVYIQNKFLSYLQKNLKTNFSFENSYENHTDLPANIDVFISIGGDGTFLESVSIVRNRNIPIVGLNTGRLGFLANIQQEEIPLAIDAILNNNYTLEQRSLLGLQDYSENFNNFPYALNEITVQKKGTSMVTIHTYIDEEFLNSYWSDGLIISTPTGSTAYSLSVGGPIVMPQTNSIIISPISPHNLSVRPIVLPDNVKIQIEVESRSPNYLLSMDHRFTKLKTSHKIQLKKADFKIIMLKFNKSDFFSTIRSKLMWGADKRN